MSNNLNIDEKINETNENLETATEDVNKDDLTQMALNTVFNIVLIAKIKDASNLESLVLYKLKNESTEDIRRLSEMYTYMPELFDHYFSGHNIFKI